MDPFPGKWPSSEDLHMMNPNNDEGRPQTHTSEMQNADWMDCIKAVDQENPTTGFDFIFHDFDAASHPPSDPADNMYDMPLEIGMSFSVPSSEGSATITPPDIATQPGQTWQPINPSKFNSPTAAPTSQLWRPAQMHTPGHVDRLDLQGLHLQTPTTPQCVPGYQDANLDGTYLVDATRGPYNAVMPNVDVLPHCSDQNPDLFTDEATCHYGDDESEPDPCYAQLLNRCFRQAPDLTMSLKEIYHWVEHNSNKVKDKEGRGWQNSVRHNLSMNDAFQRAPSTAGRGPKKNSLWRLSEEALRGGVISTTRYRKDPKRKKPRKDAPAAPNRQQSGTRGSQATRAATRRTREINQARGAPRSTPFEQHFRHHQARQPLGTGSPLFFPSSATSSIPTMSPMGPSPASPLVFSPERHEHFPQFASHPCTPAQQCLAYEVPFKPAVENFELLHIGYPNAGPYGGHDFEQFGPTTTPGLTTDTGFMSDDAMEAMFPN